MNKEKALKNQGLEFREDMCMYGGEYDGEFFRESVIKCLIITHGLKESAVSEGVF